MQKTCVLFLVILLLLLGVCGCHGDMLEAADTPAPSEASTPTPDFSGTDFSGRWYVSEIIDSNGMPLSDTEKQALGAGFTLEFLSGGTYFVYDADGEALGQGDYGVTLNELTLMAESAQTTYEIVDADTLRIIQPDESVTVMKRAALCQDDDGSTGDAPDYAGASDDSALNKTPEP